jgi:hypothetical protein
MAIHPRGIAHLSDKYPTRTKPVRGLQPQKSFCATYAPEQIKGKNIFLEHHSVAKS